MSSFFGRKCALDKVTFFKGMGSGDPGEILISYKEDTSGIRKVETVKRTSSLAAFQNDGGDGASL